MLKININIKIVFPWPELAKEVVLSGKVLSLKLSYLLNLPYSVNSDIGEKHIMCSWHIMKRVKIGFLHYKIMK